jgi:ATP-dependent RNA helicase DeaD
MKFTELNLPASILSALNHMGFEDLTPIQEETYPIIFDGKDLCALAETGSGKTAACAIPLIQKVDPSLNGIQGLVIVPTRELCIQYVDEIQNIACRTKVVPFAVYGGFAKDIQVAKLNHEVHILVATPGRLLDLVYEGSVDLSHIRCVILDEADELLKVGFLEDIERILSCIIQEHQTLLFSATMADDIKKLTHDYLKDPVHVTLIKEQATPKSIEHYFMYGHTKDKQARLVEYLKKEDVRQAILFCNARHIVEKLTRALREDFDGVEYIHAGIEQRIRTSIFNKFKKEKIRLLVATDVAGRGLDFSHISHVINWDFPGLEQYAHRTGRVGRMGKKGKAFTFVSKFDLAGLSEVIRVKGITPLWIGDDPFKNEGESRAHSRSQAPKHSGMKRPFKPHWKKKDNAR